MSAKKIARQGKAEAGRKDRDGVTTSVVDRSANHLDRKAVGRFPSLSASLQANTLHVIEATYEGLIVSFTGDGWFDATSAADRFGKEPAQWLRLPSTKSYVAALKRKYVNFTHLKTLRGAAGGTWLHPKLAVPFTRWLDLDFAVWCDEQIDHILRGGLSVWQKPGSDRSNTADREALLTAAAAIVARHRLPFGPVYEALNAFAGVAHARQMTCDQVIDAAELGARLLTGNATSDDFAQIERHRAQLGRPTAQLSLLGGVQ